MVGCRAMGLADLSQDKVHCQAITKVMILYPMNSGEFFYWLGDYLAIL
jgi:hypothetical protein